MSTPTVSAPAPLTTDPHAQSAYRAATPLLYRWRWLVGAVVMLVIGYLVVHWARARPGYDPYGWLVWGHLTIHGKLDTNGAPSWKPLPYLFTLPYALAGRHELVLWMTTAFAISLAGVVFAYRVAFVLVDAPPERRYAAYLAGLIAGAGLLGVYQYLHSIFSAESDTIIVTLCLAAADCILHRRYRWAFWMWWLAALGRPEAWGPLAIYVAWAWRNEPEMRRQIVAGLVLIPLLWFGIPAISSKSAFSAGSLAENSPREIHGNKITGTISRFDMLNATSVKLAALLAAIDGLARRDRAVALFTGGVVLWVLIEIAFALHGWPAVPRYLYEAGGGVCVLAGVFFGRIVLAAPRVLAALSGRLPSVRWLRAPATSVAAVAIVLLAFVVSLHGAARERLVYERGDLTAQRARTKEINLLATVLHKLGPSRIWACGHPNIPIAFQSILAWDIGSNTGILYWDPKHQREHPIPVVAIYPHSYGWQVFPANVSLSKHPSACAGLTYRTT